MYANLWPNLVRITTDESSLIYREALKRTFDALKQKFPNQATTEYITTVGGYQPNYDILNQPSGDTNKLLAEMLNPLSTEYWNEFTKEEPSIPKNVKFGYTSWFVEYQPGGYQNLHMHKQSFFTNVWFLDIDPQAPGAGELHLQNANPGSYLLGFSSPVKKITPKTGDIITIPSWVQHNVTPCTGRRLVFVWDTFVMPA